MNRMLRLTAIVLIASAAQAASTINGNTWFPVGPAPTTNGQAYGSPSRVDVGGRSGPIAINPANANEIYLGTANGGVWHTTDGGMTWRPESDQLEALAIGALVLDGCTAAGCDRVFAGTGENAIRRDTYRGAGLYIGQITGPVEFPEWTWTQKGASVFRNGSINNIIVQGSKIFVTLSSGETASASESTVTAPAPPQGYAIYRSTSGGNEWTKLNVSGSNDAKPTSLIADPQDPNTLYAGFMGRGVFKSTNGGDSWCPVTPGINVVGCAGSSGLPNPSTTTFDFVEVAIRHPAAGAAVLYASVGVCGDPITADCQPGIYRSDDGGMNWTQKQAPIASSSGIVGGCPRAYSRYTHVLKVDPNNSDTLYLGGYGLCRSTNSGQNFTSLGGLHPDQHDLAFAPGNASRLFSSNDGGIYESPDGGVNWYSRNDDLQIMGFQSMSASPLSPAVTGGTQDNGTMLWVGTRVWRHIDDGDSAATVIDLDDPNRIFDLYTRQCPRRGSTSGGFSDIFNGLGSTYSGCYSSFTYPEDSAFYPPITQDPQSPHALYIGTVKLYRTLNDGNQWDVVSPNLAGGGSFPDIRTGNVISAIAVSPSNHNIVYIGYYDGRIFVSDAGTGPCPNASCWHESNTGATPDAPVTRIAVHPTMQNVAYAAFSGFASGAHLFKTTSTGGSWSAVGATLPQGEPVNTVTIEANDAERIWVGTDHGIYKSTTGGNDWTRFSTGLPNVPVYEIALDEVRGRAWAGTHGRGAFVLTKPLISNFEGWVNGGIWDIPVYGTGFLPNKTCTMAIIRQNGTTCASGTIDGDGGTIQTDASGQLVTSKGAFYNGRAVAWGCLNGHCVGGTSVNACNQAGNPITSVVVDCGGGASVAIEHVTGCQQQDNPPQSVLGLDGLEGGGGGGGGGGGVSPLPPGPNPPPPPSGAEQRAFYVVPTVQAGDGSTRALCSVRVTFTAGEARGVVIQRAADLINTSATCSANGVNARVSGNYPEPTGGGEDLPAYDPHLVISAPSVRGSQLMPAFQADPGQATNLCFDLQGLGVATSGQLEITRVRFATPPGGAAGGMLRLREVSDIGTCEIDVPTFAGQNATQIAGSVAAAFNTPGIPGPHLRCPASHNPRDVVQEADSILTVLPHTVQVCIGDSGLGVLIQPDELTHRFPVANAGGDRSVASTNVALDGTLSTDPDSTPGTADGIVLYSWSEIRPDATVVPLGNGAVVNANLAEGLHHVTLRVTNKWGLSDTAVAAIQVGEGGGGALGTAVSASVFLSQADARTNHGVLFGIPRHGTTDYRDVALRLRYAPTAHDAVVVQLRHQRHGQDPRPLLRSDVDLEWGFYEHVFGSKLNVRAGRAPIPAGIWNALREVGTALPFFTAPAAVYQEGGALNETVDGIVASWPVFPALDLAAWGGGGDQLEQVPGTANAARARNENTVGVSGWVTPLPHLRFGVAASRFSVRDGLMRVNTSDTWHSMLASVDASFPNWDVRAEYLASRRPLLLSGIAFPKVDSRGGYVEAGIAVLPQLWIHGQAEFQKSHFKRPAQPTLHVNIDRNYALGADYLFQPHVVLKLEGHVDRGYLSQDQNLDVFTDPRPKIRYGIVTVAVSF